jgi:hypothetical protein
VSLPTPFQSDLIGVTPQTLFPLARSEIAEGDVRIGEVKVWVGKGHKLNRNFEKKHKKKKRTSFGGVDVLMC